MQVLLDQAAHSQMGIPVVHPDMSFMWPFLIGVLLLSSGILVSVIEHWTNPTRHDEHYE